MKTLEVLSSSKKESNVKKALKKSTKKINKELSKIPGSIANMNVNTQVGLSGASVNLSVTVEDKNERFKKILWANKGGSSEEKALERAKEEINPKISNIKGELADSYTEYISPPLPQKVYLTMVLAVNKKIPKNTKNLSARERRSRINEIISLAGGDPKIINISKIAKSFNVTRDVIYNDLEKLEINR